MDHNEPRMRTTYTIDASPQIGCLCAYHAAQVMRANGWSAYKSAGRDYCEEYRDGRCDSDFDLVSAAVAHVENARLARHRGMAD